MKSIRECRACGSQKLTQFLDLGKQYIADFREDDSKPPSYPLVAVFCEDCKLVQLKHTTPQVEMYHNNYGFKSGISDSIKNDLDDNVLHAFQYVNDPKAWLDIASNDGTLLSFVPDDIHRTGVDPVEFLCKEAEQHADLIINDYFTSDIWSNVMPEFDVITSISCFYDMPNPMEFVGDVTNVLAPKGVWIIQQNYLLTTLQLGAVDNFCHEHLEYYTLMSLENLLDRFGLEVNEVKLLMVNGGSIRTVVSRRGTFPVDDSVHSQRKIEQDYGLDHIDVYDAFTENMALELDKLYRLVNDLHADGKKIAILAASTRGATIWQSAGIDHKLIEYAIERNEAKVGKMFSQIGVPIVSELYGHLMKPDYLLIGPWFFAEEIMEREKDYLKAGSKFIVPLPEVTIYE